MNNNYSIEFELCVRQFLGDKAYGIASSFGNEIRVRQWLRKCLVEAKKRVDNIDTTARHKEMMMRNIDDLLMDLKLKGSLQKPETVVGSFWLISRLLGLDYANGKTYNEIFYYQKPSQYARQLWAEGKSREYRDNERKNWISLRKRIISTLKNKGISDYDVAQVLNISESELKKYKHNL